MTSLYVLYGVRRYDNIYSDDDDVNVSVTDNTLFHPASELISLEMCSIIIYINTTI